MGKEVGHKCTRRSGFILLLAFFTVVASSPNLSTINNKSVIRLQSYE